MTPERWFTQELQPIHPKYFAFFDERRKRWEIRNQITRDKSILVMRVAEYDGDMRDIGYHPLDRRVIHALKLRRFYSDNPMILLREVDEANNKLMESSDKESNLAWDDCGRNIKRHYMTKSVFLGG